MTASLAVMAGAIVSPSLPALEQHFFDVPRIDYLSRFIITVPSLFMAILAPFAGYVIDTFGRRKLLVGGVILYAAAGVGGAVFDSITAILISRAFLGISTAAIMTTVGTLIGDYFSGAARNRFMGYRNASNNFGGVIYLVLGGFVATLDWRAPFFIYLVALVVLPMILKYITEPDTTAVRNGGADGADSTPIPWLEISWLYFAAFIFGVTFYMIPTQIPFFLIELGFDDPTLAGVGVAASTLATATTALFYGRIRRYVAIETMFIFGFALSAVGFFAMGWAGTLPVLFLGLLLFGAGQGSTTANFSIRLLELAPFRVRGRIMGGQATAIMMGFFVSPLVSQSIAKAANLSVAFFTAAGLLLLVSVVFALRRNRRHDMTAS
ncbi:MAG: MFS transporter [Alphaproteobacteria bacterium]